MISVEQVVKENVSKFIDQLLEIGESTAQVLFNAHAMTYEDYYPVTVTSNKVDWNEGEIVASGDDVLFQEFGTGVGAIHPNGQEYGFVPGSWSKDHAQQFTQKGYWYYNGKRYVGQPPAMAMYQARKTIEMNEDRIWREVSK